MILKSENATRWSRLYTSLGSVFRSFDKAKLANHQNNDEGDNIMRNINQELLKQLVEFLEPFKHATKKLEEKKQQLYIVYCEYSLDWNNIAVKIVPINRILQIYIELWENSLTRNFRFMIIM